MVMGPNLFSSPPAQLNSGTYSGPAPVEYVQECLFHFLDALSRGQILCGPPLVVEEKQLHQLYDTPAPDLVEALRHCLCRLARDIGPGDLPWSDRRISPAIWGFVLAAHDCIAGELHTANGRDVVMPFLAALWQTLSPVQKVQDALVVHAVLDTTAAYLPRLGGSRADILRALVLLNPLTSITHLDSHIPPPLLPLAAEMIPRRDEQPADRWNTWDGQDQWLGAVTKLLEHPPVARYVRRRWLELPETRRASRNLGLLLEGLRERGARQRVLEFYAAWHHFRARTVDSPRGPWRTWPLMDRAQQLLQASSPSPLSSHLNHRGLEYMLLLLPLLRIFREDTPLPVGFGRLRWEMLQRLEELERWLPRCTCAPGGLGEIRFGDDPGDP